MLAAPLGEVGYECASDVYDGAKFDGMFVHFGHAVELGDFKELNEEDSFEK